jgi:hypothetical protein
MRTGSYLNAQFRGQQYNELTWFGFSGNAPGLSISAARAATEIVDGIRRRKNEIILSTPAKLLARLHGLAPASLGEALAAANRLLPNPAEGRSAKLAGRTILEQRDGPRARALAKVGSSAVARYQ